MPTWEQKIVELENELKRLKKANSGLEARIQRLEQDSQAAGEKPRSPYLRKSRLNCWEFIQCGREPGGVNVAELGVCPASEWEKQERINGGRRGGRVCWALVGTLCGGRVQGVYAQKIDTCSNCEFYHYVRLQEGQDFRYALPAKG